jgi:hypothetical protein
LLSTARAEIVALADAARFDRGAVRGFFDSFDDGAPARSLAKLSQTKLSRETLDRVGMLAMFSMEDRDRVEFPPYELNALARRSALLFAALCPVVGPDWQRVGWPSKRSLANGRDRWEAVIEFARRTAPQLRLELHDTWRYDVDLSTTPLLQATIEQLDADLGESFADLVLVQPSWCLAPTVFVEGARFLLRQHRSAPESTAAAVLVGHALGQFVSATGLRPRPDG